MASSLIPPGGLAGFAQMTPASQRALTKGVRSSGGTTRRRRKATSSPRKRRAKSGTKRARKARLVKGSRAAKAYMAKLRRMRKK